MQVEDTRLGAVHILRPRRPDPGRSYVDRGRTDRQIQSLGIPGPFVEEHQQFTRNAGMLYGLRYQAPPYAQERLVSVIAGEITQVAVDMRAGSPFFGQWTRARLSSDTGRQMFIPAGFLQGYVTLVPDTTVLAQVTTPRIPQAESCVAYDDPTLGIDWGVSASAITVSRRDRAAPNLSQWQSPFIWAGEAA